MSHRSPEHARKKHREEKQKQRKALHAAKAQAKALQGGPAEARKGRKRGTSTDTPGFRVFTTERGLEIDNIPQLLAEAAVPIILGLLALFILITQRLSPTLETIGWMGFTLLVIAAIFPFRRFTQIQVLKNEGLITVRKPFSSKEGNTQLKRIDVKSFEEFQDPAHKKLEIRARLEEGDKLVALTEVGNPRACKALIHHLAS